MHQNPLFGMCLFLQTSTALNLAVFRVTLGAVLLSSAEVWAAAPSTPRTLLLMASFAGAVGAASQVSFCIVTVAAWQVLGAAQVPGSLTHTHHLIWFSALLSASPCGDAFGVDAWLAHRRGVAAPHRVRVAYGLPLRAVWLLIAVIFLFPGLAKLGTSDWWTGEVLRRQIYWKWFQHGGPPSPLWLRVDTWPGFLPALASAALLFELGVGAAFFHHRTRALAVAAALLFHAGTAILMGIHFSSLYFCYVVFVDWSGLLRRLRRPVSTAEVARTWQAPDRPGPLSIAVIAFTVAGAVGAGAFGVAVWPFARYPSFHRLLPLQIPELQVSISNTSQVDTEPFVVPRVSIKAIRPWDTYWRESWTLSGDLAGPAPHLQLDAHWEALRSVPEVARHLENLGAAAEIRFERVQWSVLPEDAAAPPHSRLLLYARSP